MLSFILIVCMFSKKINNDNTVVKSNGNRFIFSCIVLFSINEISLKFLSDSMTAKKYIRMEV